MISRIALAATLLFSTTAFAQALDPLRTVSGTTPHTGLTTPWIASRAGGWTFFHGFDAHVTYASQTGPEEQENDVFSTNWITAGLERDLGNRGFILVRGRVSLEPYTIEDTYPQIFQYVGAENNGERLVNRMRGHDLFGEAGVQIGWRPTTNTLLHAYGAVVGQPALGPAPAQLRASGVDFAEAPFSYDIAETYSDSTSVITGGFATRWLAVDASVFHDANTTGDHTELDSGDIDSRSARVTITPTPNFALQYSRGELGEDLAQRDITSASVTYGGPMVAVTALWTRREYDERVARLPETAYGFELALRGSRNTFMARVEHMDRPVGFPFPPPPATATVDTATHYTAGYLFDFTSGPNYRLGVGVNVDYRTRTRELEEVYGHKPQGIYTFVRFRTGGI
jgi:hypothetical protein